MILLNVLKLWLSHIVTLGNVYILSKVKMLSTAKYLEVKFFQAGELSSNVDLICAGFFIWSQTDSMMLRSGLCGGQGSVGDRALWGTGLCGGQSGAAGLIVLFVSEDRSLCI